VGPSVSLVGADDRMPPQLSLSHADPEDWVEALSIPGPSQDPAMSRLHEMMLRACRHQVRRMRPTLAGVGNERLEEIANQAADEAMMAVLAKLSTFEGAAGSPRGPTSSQSSSAPPRCAVTPGETARSS
jgi:RNA polymerase sigma-70 factor, ECF subfamily